ncbi:hypothetical protein O2K51_05290 [Apibacter raozihei]|nr:hypothetical protein [Apibacter raozihei]
MAFGTFFAAPMSLVSLEPATLNVYPFSFVGNLNIAKPLGFNCTKKLQF